MIDLFKEKARNWDMHEMRQQLSNNISRTMIESGGFSEDMTVMDFGAGTGLIAGNIASLVKKVLAIDISEAMLEQLSQKEELQGKVETLCQDIVIDGIEARFDRIVSAMALHHVEDTDKACQSFYTHLKAGGKLLLADLDAEDGTFHPSGMAGVFHSGFDRDFLQGKLEKVGFSNVQFQTALVVPKNGKEYPVFLLTAIK